MLFAVLHEFGMAAPLWGPATAPKTSPSPREQTRPATDRVLPSVSVDQAAVRAEAALLGAARMRRSSRSSVAAIARFSSK